MWLHECVTASTLGAAERGMVSLSVIRKALRLIPPLAARL